MNVLITGITGHVGLSSAIALSKIVTVYGVYNKQILKSVKNILLKNNIKILKLNLLDKKKILKIIKSKKIQYCIHAAAVSHEIYAKKNIKNTLDINCNAVLNFLQLQKKKKFKFILISTGSVFQDLKNKKKLYENSIPSPISLYSGSKRMGEILLNSHRNYFKNNACILRLSWVYGPPIITKKINIQRGPIPIILYEIIKKNKKSFFLKSGKDFRASFTYIEDVANSLKKLIKKNKFDKNIYHLGSGKNNSLKELFLELKKIFPKIKFKLGKGAMPWSNDSVMRPPLASKYNLQTKISLKEGLTKYSTWLKKNA